MQTSSYILSLTIWVPIFFGILVLFLHRNQHKSLARVVALAGSILGLLVAIPLWIGFDNTSAAMQFVQSVLWIPRYNIHYALGVDGISMLFVLLNSFTTILVIAASWEVIQEKVSQYLACFLIMSGLINGVFAATDAILFYLFFEAMLIPMFLIIGIWGGPRRVYAAV
ncbi:MAG: proton-conducting transporter membrane subunit, partial [Burkholderiales bacterium]